MLKTRNECTRAVLSIVFAELLVDRRKTSEIELRHNSGVSTKLKSETNRELKNTPSRRGMKLTLVGRSFRERREYSVCMPT